MNKKEQVYPILGKRSRRILEILIKVLVSGLKEAWHFSEHFFLDMCDFNPTINYVCNKILIFVTTSGFHYSSLT